MDPSEEFILKGTPNDPTTRKSLEEELQELGYIVGSQGHVHPADPGHDYPTYLDSPLPVAFIGTKDDPTTFWELVNVDEPVLRYHHDVVRAVLDKYAS